MLRVSLSHMFQDEDLDNDEGDEIVWKDPTTGKTFVVDKRTGNSYPRKVATYQGEVGCDSVSAECSHRRTLPQYTGDVDDASMPDWIRTALQVSASSLPFGSLF